MHFNSSTTSTKHLLSYLQNFNALQNILLYF